MSFDTEVGAEVDLGPLVFELMGGLKASLDTLNKRLHNIAKMEEAYEFGATQVKLGGVASSDSASDAFEIGLGGPAYGMLWHLRSLVIGGVLWTTTVAGSALVIVGPSRASAVPIPAPPLTDIVDQAASLPFPTQYGTGQIVVRHPNHLRIVILTPTASTQYAAGGWATQFPDKRLKIYEGE